jgi:hypothetical protein
MRIAIVATGLWLLSASVYFLCTGMQDAMAVARQTLAVCQQFDTPKRDCWHVWQEEVAGQRHALLTVILPIQVLLPVFIAWIVGWLGILVFRWVKKGFDRPD